jgi:hypothetical protein
MDDSVSEFTPNFWALPNFSSNVRFQW